MIFYNLILPIPSTHHEYSPTYGTLLFWLDKFNFEKSNKKQKPIFDFIIDLKKFYKIISHFCPFKNVAAARLPGFATFIAGFTEVSDVHVVRLHVLVHSVDVPKEMTLWRYHKSI